MAYVPPDRRTALSESDSPNQTASPSIGPDERCEPLPFTEDSSLHVDDIHEHFWPPPTAVVATNTDTVASCSPRMLRSHGTLNASADDPNTLKYVVLFSGANPRWESERIVFVKSNLELLPGGREVVRYFENEGKPTEEEVEQALRRVGFGPEDESENGCRGKAGRFSDIRLEESQALGKDGATDADDMAKADDAALKPDDETADVEGDGGAPERSITEAMEATNIYEDEKEASTCNENETPGVDGGENQLRTADKEDDVGEDAETRNVHRKLDLPFLEPSVEMITTHPPVVLFTQPAGLRSNRNKGFSYFAHARLSNVEYIPPMSEKLLRVMAQKFGDATRRNPVAWKQSWSNVWAVVKLDLVEGVGENPEVKKMERAHHGRTDGDKGRTRGGRGGGRWARAGSGRGRTNWGRSRGGTDGQGVNGPLGETRGDNSGGSREECRENITPENESR